MKLDKMQPIPFRDRYLIAKNGVVFDTATGSVLRQTGSEEKFVTFPDTGDTKTVASQVLLTYTGPFCGRVHYKRADYDPSSDNVEYEISSIRRVTDDLIVLNSETFKRIPGFSKYFISPRGVVYSDVRSKFIAYSFNYADYTTVTITSDIDSTDRKPKKVHRLVYITYIGPLAGPNVVLDHNDNRRYNNACWNLAQITTADNVQKAMAGGNFQFTRDKSTIRRICQMLQDNMEFSDIATAVGATTKSEYEALVRLVKRLVTGRGGHTYPGIVAQYDIRNYGDLPDIESRRRGTITEDEVRYAWAHKDDMTQTEIAYNLKCSPSLISQIFSGKIWKGVNAGSTTIERITN